MGLRSSLLWDEQKEQGQPILLLKEVAVFPPAIHLLPFAGTSVSLLPGELKQETLQIWPSEKSSVTVVPPPDHWKLQHKGGSKPWVREYFLPSEAMQVFSSLKCVCTLSCVVCVWLEGYQSGLGCAWDVRNILWNGRVEEDLEVHAWWVHWSRINSFRQV